MGFVLPFTLTGLNFFPLNNLLAFTCFQTASDTIISSEAATEHKREAKFTESPITVKFICCLEPIFPLITFPLLIPIPMVIGSLELIILN